MSQLPNENDERIALSLPINEHKLLTKKFRILAGKLTIPDDFDDPLPDDVLTEFESN